MKKQNLLLLRRITLMLFALAFLSVLKAQPPKISWLRTRQENIKSKVSSLCQYKSQRQEDKNHLKRAEKWVSLALKFRPKDPLSKEKRIHLMFQNGKAIQALTLSKYANVPFNDTIRGPIDHLERGQLIISASLEMGNSTILNEAKSELAKAMYLDSLRCCPDFFLQSEANYCYAMAILFDASSLSSRGKKDSLKHWHIAPHRIEAAQQYLVNALNYNPKHEEARKSLSTLEGLLNKVNATVPFDTTCACNRKNTIIVVDTTLLNPPVCNGVVVSNKEKPSEAYFETVLRQVARYDELVLAIDYSYSMHARLNDAQRTRWQETKILYTYIARHLPSRVKLGAITIGGTCNVTPKLKLKVGTDRCVLMDEIENLSPEGMTPLHSILDDTPTLFTHQMQTKKGMLILSDGMESCGNGLSPCEIAQMLARENVETNLVSMLDGAVFINHAVFQAYQCLVDLTGGKFFSFEKNAPITEKKSRYDFIDLSVALPNIEIDKCNLPYKQFSFRESERVTLYKSAIAQFNNRKKSIIVATTTTSISSGNSGKVGK
ncbi:MAG: hypothetical protein RLZZ292_3841 [Bacteroidota bacterium]|jgi:Mg-chelatase subunit ChlD